MKIVFALDSWKGSLTAMEACVAVAKGVRDVLPKAELILCPMADGGEGTLEQMVVTKPGQLRICSVCGPLPAQTINAPWLWWPEEHAGLVEMALCAGLPLLAPDERDPLRTTTRGVGELMADAIRLGVRHLTLAVGGSATVDGGVGAASALGWRFLDKEGHLLLDGGGALEALDRILPPAQPFPASVEVLCDVTNPLTGPKGAAAVFAPQKGASPAEVEILERGLRQLARVAERDLGRNIADVPGTGAAGGLSAGMLLFCNARLVSGVDAVMRLTGLEEKLRGADWVVTGEGCLDAQSLDGKVVSGILRAAHKASVRTAVVAGQVVLSDLEIACAGIDAAFAANDAGLPLAEVLREARGLARAAGRRLAARLI